MVGPTGTTFSFDAPVIIGISESTSLHFRLEGFNVFNHAQFFGPASVEGTGDKAAYIKNRAFDKQHYKDMVMAYIEKFGEATRTELDELLLAKLSDALDRKQKGLFIMNLLQEMKREGRIAPEGSRRWTRWRLHKPVD